MKNLFTLTVFLFCVAGNAAGQEAKVSITEMAADPDYGLTDVVSKSIKVGSVENEYHYIRQLTGPKGEQIDASRSGSCCMFRTGKTTHKDALLDVWEIEFAGQEAPVIIYLNPYQFEQPKCPQGLGFKK